MNGWVSPLSDRAVQMESAYRRDRLRNWWRPGRSGAGGAVDLLGLAPLHRAVALASLVAGPGSLAGPGGLDGASHRPP